MQDTHATADLQTNMYGNYSLSTSACGKLEHTHLYRSKTLTDS